MLGLPIEAPSDGVCGMTTLQKPSSSSTKRFSHSLNRLIQILPIFVVTSMGSGGSVFAQTEVFSSIEPFLGTRYGMGYDTAAQGPSKAGQSCVNFDPSKVNSESDGKSASKKTVVTRSSELVKKMDLSAMAQVKALTGQYEGKSILEVADKSEVHQFSETKLFYTYRTNDTSLLLTEHISIKPQFQTLLGNGIRGLDEFRAKCGNAFVLGQQTGAYYFGTSFKSINSTSSSSQLNLNVDFSFEGAFNVDSYLAFANSEKQKIQEEKEEIASTTSDLKLVAPGNSTELEEQWKKFSPEGSDDTIIKAVIAPYTVAKGALPEGLLAGTADAKKLEVLLEGLWDLKTLKDAAQFILKKPDKFALGLPSGSKRDARLEHVRKLHQQWQAEFDKLLVDTKACLNSFDDNCAKLANSYESNPRISQESKLPKKYRNNCYGVINVQQKETEPAAKFMSLSHGVMGDEEMGGGPVLVRSTLRISPDGSQLRAFFAVTLEENKKDHTIFVGSQDVVLFDHKQEQGMENPLDECEFADPPITNRPVRGSDVYGIAEGKSGEDPRGYKKFNGTGLLRSIICILDTDYDDNGKLFCEPPQINTIHVSLVNKLDKEAENWKNLEDALLPDRPFVKMKVFRQ